MASRESKPVKQLKDLLQEQQEPFILDVYLLERGYLRKSLNSGVYFNCCHGNSTKSLKRSASCDQKKQKSNPHCSKVFRAVHKQVASINERLRTRSSNVRDGNSDVPEESKNAKEVAELDRFSSASSTTVFNSCSETDAEETSASKNVNKSQSFRLGNKIEKEAATDRSNLQPQFIEGCNQHSPVSVLEDTVIHGGKAEGINAVKDINSKRFKFTKKVMEDSVLSASLWEILVNSGRTQKPNKKLEMQELIKSKTFSQYTKSKTVLHQTRQLLFDCITEVVETQERKKQQQHGYEYLETEELGRLLGKKEKKWEKNSGKGSNLTKLLELDFVDSAQEWSEHAQQLGGIGKEIQESILEDIKDEIVMSLCLIPAPNNLRANCIDSYY